MVEGRDISWGAVPVLCGHPGTEVANVGGKSQGSDLDDLRERKRTAVKFELFFLKRWIHLSACGTYG